MHQGRAGRGACNDVTLPGQGAPQCSPSLKRNWLRSTIRAGQDHEDVGLQVPANEVVFFPTLPLRIATIRESSAAVPRRPTRTTKGEALVAPGREPFRFEEDGDGNPVVIGAGFHCFPNANGQRTNNDVALLGKWLVGMVAPRARASRSLRNRLLFAINHAMDDYSRTGWAVIHR